MNIILKLLKKLKKNTPVASRKVFYGVKSNLAELYTMLVLFVALPGAIAALTDIKWGVLLSFALQALIGILYIRGKS